MSDEIPKKSVAAVYIYTSMLQHGVKCDYFVLNVNRLLKKTKSFSLSRVDDKQSNYQ